MGIAYSYVCGARKAISLGVDEIDELIAQYTNAAHRIGANLHALGTDPVFELVQSASLPGESGRRARTATQQSDRLWPVYLGLQSTLDRVHELRGDRARLSNRNRDQLIPLLTEKSVVVEGEPEPMTIQAALATMREIYEPLAEAVAQFNDVLTTALPRIAAYEESLQRWETEADTLGYRSDSLGRARDQLDEVRQRASDDPLAVTDAALDAVATSVKNVGVEVAEAARDRASLPSDLATMATVLSELRELRAQAAAAYRDATDLIVAPIGLVRVPPEAAIDGAEGLQSRLDVIVADQGDWQTMRAAMDPWIEHTERLRAQLERALARNRMPLDYRSELRGRLGAFRAKLEATGSVDAIAIDLADDIHNELYTAPSDLGRADRMLNELTLRLTGKEQR